VEHDHGRTVDSGCAAASAARGAHGSGPAVATRVPAGALGLFAAVVMLRVVQKTYAFGPLPHLVNVLVVVLAGRRALVAAPIRRRRAEVLVRSGAGAAVAAVHLHLDCEHGKIGRPRRRR